MGLAAGWKYAPAGGWIATAAFYLFWTWASVAKMSAAAIEIVVQQRHPARATADAIIVGASIASLGGVAYLLVAGTARGPDASIAAIVGFLSLVASWLAVHAVYTLRYAALYYTEPVGGIDFNQEEKPTFADFVYLAFTIAVTYGVIDTAVRNGAIRRSVLQHSLVSYLLGTRDRGDHRPGDHHLERAVAGARPQSGRLNYGILRCASVKAVRPPGSTQYPDRVSQ